MSPINNNSTICSKRCSIEDTVFVLFLYNHWLADVYHKMIYWRCLPYRFLVVFSYSRWFLNIKSAQPKKQLHFIRNSHVLFLISLSDFPTICHKICVNFFNPHMLSSQLIWTNTSFIKIKRRWKIHWNNSLIVKSKPTEYAYLCKVVWGKGQANERRLGCWMVPNSRWTNVSQNNTETTHKSER